MTRQASATLSFFVLVALLTAARTQAQGQVRKEDTAPASTLAGTGEQMRALAAVCRAWEQPRKSVTAGTAMHTSPNLRDYNFEITQDATNYIVRLWPKKPVVKRIPTSAGTYLENESTTFQYQVRRSDFKIVGVSAVL